MKDIKGRNIDFWTHHWVWNRTEKGLEKPPESSEAFAIEDAFRYAREPDLQGLFQEILRPGEVSLEIGCGLGTDVREFAKRGLKAVGIDYSPENAFLSQNGITAMNLPALAIAGDGEYLCFPDASFDLVYSWGVLHHTPDTERSFRELQRVLKPGGRLVVMMYHKGYQYLYIMAKYLLLFKWLRHSRQDYISQEYDQTPLSRMFNRKELADLCAGMEDIQVQVRPYGGIQFHPILKYLLKLFETFPSLAERFGSFGIVMARKPGHATPGGEIPPLCCPLCHHPLEQGSTTLACPGCHITYPIHKGQTPVLHPNANAFYSDWVKNHPAP